MTREEAIKRLNKIKAIYKGMDNKSDVRALDMAIKALEQTDGDLISRQAVLDIISDVMPIYTDNYHYILEERIKDLSGEPSAEKTTLRTEKTTITDGDLISRFRDYQIEWLTSHNDIDLQETEMWVVQFLKDTAECFLKTELPSAEKTAKWIPVSKRLPEKLKDVLVAFYDCPGEYDVAYLRTTFNETYKKNGAKNEWVSSMGETTYADYEVDAWMPIEPYKAESEEEE